MIGIDEEKIIPLVGVIYSDLLHVKSDDFSFFIAV